MDISIKYVVYKVNPIMGNKDHLSLEKVDFNSWGGNSFDSEEDAIRALHDDGKTYEVFTILKKVFIRDQN